MPVPPHRFLSLGVTSCGSPSCRVSFREPGNAKAVRNCCGPKRSTFTWFFSRKNHTSRSLSDHGNCETAIRCHVSIATRKSRREKILRRKGQLTQSYSPHTAVSSVVRSKANTINTVIVTFSLPSRSPHHYHLRLLTARA